uniref:G_PROTEIN_RECEP_F1_2 domain-containing protein n=1 Tax=Macrostomum lignano TaxID=282301 RepID=A0A1I8HPW8_9PLAT
MTTMLVASCAKNVVVLVAMRLESPGSQCCIALVDLLSTFSIADLILRLLLPAIILLLSNLIALAKLASMASLTKTSAASTARKEIRTFRMLLVLLLMVLRSLSVIHWSNESQRLYSFLLLLAYTNHGINFYICLTMSSRLRTRVRILLLTGCFSVCKRPESNAGGGRELTAKVTDAT